MAEKETQKEETKEKKPVTGRQIFAWIGIGLIALWLLITAVIAVFPVPGKARLFPFFMIGCIVFPVFIWVGMWIYGAVTGKKNVASFRSEEMEETMRRAEEIKQAEENKQTDEDGQNEDK